METIAQAEVAISSWRPSEGEVAKSDAKVLRVTEESIKTLLYYKKVVLPSKLLEEAGLEELKKKIGDFKMMGSLPTDIQRHIPEEFRGIQEWSLQRGFEATLAISELGWQSVVNERFLGTFIARLFVNS